jgi:tetratricopeptide (TPR) repeat protein
VIANAELNLGDIFLAKGDLAQAQEFLEGVHCLVNDPVTSEWSRWRYAIHLFASLGELWLARGDVARAGAFAEQCLELATRTNSRKYLVRGGRLTGEIALARRQWNDAEEALRQTLRIAEALGNPTQLWKTHLAFARLYGERNEPEFARQAYQRAREVIDRVKGTVRNAELRAGLDHSPLILQVDDLSASG